MTATYASEWGIKAIQTRYKAEKGIDLNTDQAEKMFLFEEERDSLSSKYSFSIWEEVDYEEFKFKEILTSAQFESYISERVNHLKLIEATLIENDKQYIPQLNAAEDRLKYYRDILIPSMSKNLMSLNVIFFPEREKVVYIKSVHKKYLADTKKQILVDHFRHSKTHQPILLKLSLLRHEEMLVFPDYFSFKETLDAPTKAVADFLQEKISKISGDIYNGLHRSMLNLKEFNIQNTAKHIGEPAGWHVTNSVNNKAEELMFALLL